MMANNGSLPKSDEDLSIVAPRDICKSCHSFTGPTISLSDLKVTLHGYPSNETEDTLVESNIAYAISEMKQIDDEFPRLQQTIDTIRHRRDLLEQFEKKHRNLRSLIMKLPVELLQEILVQSYHMYRTEKTPKVFWHAGHVASQVSTYFRSVSHSVPSLWTDMSILTSVYHMRPGIGLFIEKCLRLSREEPLKIVCSSSCSTNNMGSNCIRALAQSAYRWEKFETEPDQYNDPLVPAIFNHVPRHTSFAALKELKLTRLSRSIHLACSPVLERLRVERVDDPQCVITLQSTPMLSDIFLYDIMHPCTLLNTVPWSQIRSLTAIRSDGIHERLATMTNLQYLAILFKFRIPAQAILLPRLTELKLIGRLDSFVLDDLTTPSLKKLQLTLTDDFTALSLLQYLQRSGCSLEVLSMGSVLYFQVVSWSWDAEEFRSIRHLTLHLYRASSNTPLLDLLNVPQNRRWAPFPEIETLTINVAHAFTASTSDDDSEILFQAVSSRLRHARVSHSALKLVAINFAAKTSDETLTMFNKLLDLEDVRLSNIGIEIMRRD